MIQQDRQGTLTANLSGKVVALRGISYAAFTRQSTKAIPHKGGGCGGFATERSASSCTSLLTSGRTSTTKSPGFTLNGRYPAGN